MSSHLVFYALAAKTTTLAMALGSFFVSTLIGNIIGGMELVAALNYAQVFLDERAIPLRFGTPVHQHYAMPRLMNFNSLEQKTSDNL